MKKLRVLFGILLIIPAALIANYLVNPKGYWPESGSASEMLFLIFGIPIILLNILVWSDPKIAEEIFLSKWEFNAGAIFFISAISLCGFGLLVTTFVKPPEKRQPVFIPTRIREQKVNLTIIPEVTATETLIPSTLTLTSTLAPTSRPHADAPLVVYFDGGLDEGFGMGVDTSGRKNGWVAPTQDGGQCMAYPAGQTWGAVFITIGDPGSRPHPKKDFSLYGNLSVELKGQNGGETIQVGLKSDTDPDNGSETKYRVSDLTTSWKTFVIPLIEFEPINISSLYVVTEFVFETTPETVCFRNIQFLP